VATREPGGSPGAERIRELLVTGDSGRWTPNTEVLLHYAARHDHIQRNIEPALAGGRWVVCDRFFDSTLAYQGYGRGIPLDFITRLTELVCDRFRPELTVLLDIEPTDPDY
jgi:dTMP kinase